MLDKVIETLQWVKDLLEGDFIDAPGHHEDYLSLPDTISVTELNVLVTLVNSILILDKSPIRVNWGAGEIRPVREENRIYIVDEEIKNDIQLYLFVELGMTIK